MKRDEPAPAPLTPAAHHILLALADGDAHGYAIMLAVASISGGAVKLGPATLYTTIKRLLADGFIAESDERPDEDDERRRYYSLTAIGRRVLSEETARLQRLVAFARARKLTT